MIAIARTLGACCQPAQLASAAGPARLHRRISTATRTRGGSLGVRPPRWQESGEDRGRDRARAIPRSWEAALTVSLFRALSI
jgi:hypothetical protein